jgi:drug/metabolite transporter (DMT)-like permease
MRISRATLGLVLGLIGVIVFGGSLPMTRLAVQHFEPLFVTFARPALAGLLALVVLVVLRRPLPPRAIWLKLCIASVALVWGWPGLSNFAMRLISAGHGGVIAGLLPLATAIAAALILREKQTPAFWGFALLGTALVLSFALKGGVDDGFSAGDALVLLAVGICAVGYVVSGALSRQMPGWEVVSWMLVVSLPIALPGMLFTWPGPWPANFAAAPPLSMLGFVYITVMSQYVGFFFWNAGLAMGGVARVGQVQLLQTFVTLAIAALLVGERVEPLAWVVAGLVLLTILGARRSARV